jgi:hypothetical protein
MQKSPKLILILIALYFIPLAKAQEKPLNDLLSVCRKAKTETEDNGRLLQQLIPVNDKNYVEGIQLYNKARSDFETWIEYFLLESEDVINKRNKQIDEKTIREKINTALSSVEVFNTFCQRIFNQSKEPYLARSGSQSIVLEVNTCFNSAVNLLKLLKDSKKEKQETLKKDLNERLSRYHITAFTSLK